MTTVKYVIIGNSAGMVETAVSGLTAEESEWLEDSSLDAVGKAVISQDDLTLTLYKHDGISVHKVFDISADKRERTPQ